MQISQANKTSTVAGLSNDGQFSAVMDGVGFQVMVGTLYKDKPRAVVRETIANCRDSHLSRDALFGDITAELIKTGELTELQQAKRAKLNEQGFADPGTPYKIHLPTDLEPWLEFEDFGIGLTLEQAIGPVDTDLSKNSPHPVRTGGLLNTIFKSTKRGENTSIGGFGLGSKCPLSIVDTFSYRVIHNGEEHQFVVYLGDNGIPAVDWLTRDADYNPAPIKTDRSNGVVVRLDSVSPDIWRYLKTCTSDVLQTFPESEQPIINDGMYEFRPMVIEEFTDSVYFVREYFYGTMFRNKFLVESGGVIYPVDYSKITDGNLFDQDAIDFIETMANDCACVFRMPLGSVRVPPSREEISYDDVTLENISNAVGVAHEKIKQMIAEEGAQFNFLDSTLFPEQTNKMRRFFRGDTDRTVEHINKLWLERKTEPQHDRYEFHASSQGTYGTFDLYYKPEGLGVSDRHKLTILDRYKNTNVQNMFSVANSGDIILSKGWSDEVPSFNLRIVQNCADKMLVVDNQTLSTSELEKLCNKLQRSFGELKRLVPTEKIKEKIGSELERVYNVVQSGVSVNRYVVAVDTSEDGIYRALKQKAELGIKLFKQHPVSYYKNLVQQYDNFVGPLQQGQMAIIRDYKSLRAGLSPVQLTKLITDVTGQAKPFTVNELEELNSQLRSLIRVSKPQVPARNERGRNIRHMTTQDFSGFRESKMARCFNTTATITHFESGGTVLWIPELDFEAQKAECSGKYISESTFERFMKDYGGALLIIKGKRTQSRLIFEKAPNAMKVNLTDLEADMAALEARSFEDGTLKDLYRIVPYTTAWKFGFREVMASLIYSDMLVDRSTHPEIIKIRLRDIDKMRQENPAFGDFLVLNNIGLDNCINFVRQHGVVSRNFYRETKKMKRSKLDNQYRYIMRAMCHRALNSLSTDVTRLSYAYRTFGKPLSYSKPNMEALHNTDMFMQALSILAEQGVQPYDNDIKAIVDIDKLFNFSECVVKDSVEKARSVTPEQVQHHDQTNLIPDMKKFRVSLFKHLTKDIPEEVTCNMEAVKGLVEEACDSLSKDFLQQISSENKLLKFNVERCYFKNEVFVRQLYSLPKTVLPHYKRQGD